MRKIFLLLVFVCMLPISSAWGQQQNITSAEISFEFVYNGVKGTFSGFTSDSQIDLDEISKSVFKGSVESRTISTRNGLRNWSLRSRKYFDVDDYPTISFESSKVEQNGAKISVNGLLTIKSTTRPITIEFTKTSNRLTGTFSIYSSDFGIKIKKKREDNLVKATLVFGIE